MRRNQVRAPAGLVQTGVRLCQDGGGIAFDFAARALLLRRLASQHAWPLTPSVLSLLSKWGRTLVKEQALWSKANQAMRKEEEVRKEERVAKQ